jgi:hypothetical protein
MLFVAKRRRLLIVLLATCAAAALLLFCNIRYTNILLPLLVEDTRTSAASANDEKSIRATSSNKTKKHQEEDTRSDIFKQEQQLHLQKKQNLIQPTEKETDNPFCLGLDFEEKLDAILSKSKQVFVIMPAKAAGTSMKEFTAKCMKRKERDNFVNGWKKELLTKSLRLPSLITSHAYSENPMVDLATHASRQTLIIYIHREETSRLISAIKHVATSMVCKERTKNLKFLGVDLSNFHFQNNQTHCSFDEGLIPKLVEKGAYNEIGMGGSRSLSCNTFDAIEQNAPNMVLVHYKQANKLQKLLAKHHCPDLLLDNKEWKPIEANVDVKKTKEVYLQIGGGDNIKLDEWLKEKRNYIEYALSTRAGKIKSCQSKVRRMEDDLFACKDEVLQVASVNLKGW